MTRDQARGLPYVDQLIALDPGHSRLSYYNVSKCSRSMLRWPAGQKLAKLLAMQVNMHEAKTKLSELVVAAERGEEVIIARNGVAAARLVAITAEHKPVRLGVLAGEIEIGPDFDEPLTEFEPYSA